MIRDGQMLREASPLAERVLVLAPVGRDAAVLTAKLRDGGLAAVACDTIESLCEAIALGAGTALVAEEVLNPKALKVLRDALSEQEAWSDFPLIIMTGGGEAQHAAERILAAIEGAGHAVLLERPVRGSTLLSAVRVALQSRARQYQLRDLRQSLQQQVVDRTARLERQADQLRRLALDLSQTEQRERRRLASVLHDHLQQFLVAAKMRLTQLARDQNSRGTTDDVAAVQDLIAEAIRAARDLSVELRPPVLYEDGLAAALGWLKRQMHDRHGLEVALAIDESADPPDDHIRALVFEIVRELLLNVVKHAGVDRASVTLRRQDERQLCVVISDRGRGCDLAQLTASDGGFGLFSVRERLAALGGDAVYRTQPGDGFEANLTVPMAAPGHSDTFNDSMEPAPRHVNAASDAQPDQAATITVVLADDHQIVRQGIAGVLNDTPDIRVVGQAEDGQQAVRIVERQHPQVVVLDVNMPRMNGIEAARVIRQRWPHIAIIGLSVQDDPSSAESMIAAGAHRYLVKGCAAAELIGAVRSLASSSAASPAGKK